MSTINPSAVDIWAFLKSLALRLVSDPQLFAKVKTWWDATVALLNPPPQATDPNDAAIVASWLAELPPRAGDAAEKLFDGQIIKFIGGISAFIQSHPQLIAFLMQILAWMPKEDAPTPTV